MYSTSFLRDWNAYWGDRERTTFTSKQRGYCWEPMRWAPSTWEISDNHFLWKQVNFSQLQKAEIGAITHPMSHASHTMCFWKQKVSSFCIYLKVYLKIQLRRERGYVISFFLASARKNSLSVTTKGHDSTRQEDWESVYTAYVSILLCHLFIFLFIVFIISLYHPMQHLYKVKTVIVLF